jgi:uncharacterized protein YndB with AHSA1/START domain
MENNPLVLERTYDAPAEKIWQALTDPEKMKQWYFDVPMFRPEVGSRFHFMAGDSQKQYEHLCEVTEAVENKKIAYTWAYGGYPGKSEVSFELFPENGKTRLVLTHKGLETFVGAPFKRENFNQGWTHFVGALADFLAR